MLSVNSPKMTSKTDAPVVDNDVVAVTSAPDWLGDGDDFFPDDSKEVEDNSVDANEVSGVNVDVNAVVFIDALG